MSRIVCKVANKLDFWSSLAWYWLKADFLKIKFSYNINNLATLELAQRMKPAPRRCRRQRSSVSRYRPWQLRCRLRAPRWSNVLWDIVRTRILGVDLSSLVHGMSTSSYYVSYRLCLPIYYRLSHGGTQQYPTPSHNATVEAAYGFRPWLAMVDAPP